jgi:hypothetical protein
MQVRTGGQRRPQLVSQSGRIAGFRLRRLQCRFRRLRSLSDRSILLAKANELLVLVARLPLVATKSVAISLRLLQRSITR